MGKGSRSVVSLTLTGLILGGILGLSSCSKNESDEKIQAFKRSLRDDVKTLDPANAYDSVSLDVLPLIVETLYQYDYTTEKIVILPQLAAEMPVFSKDRLTVTVKIKPGVKYQDDPAFKATQGKGRVLTAQDFILAFKRLAHPGVESNGMWIFDNRVVGFSEFGKKLRETKKEDLKRVFDEGQIEGLKAIDANTIQIKLTKPYPQLIYMLTMNFTSPVPQEAIDAYSDEKSQLNDHPIGTGAFKLEKWERGHELVLVRNTNFRGDLMPSGFGMDSGKALPFLDKLTFPIIKEDQPMWLNFQKGGLDIASIPKDSFNQAISGPGNVTPELTKKGIKLNIVTGGVFYWINFNMKDKVLSNKYLRQAISSAINREKWIELFTNGRGHKMTTAAPTGLQDRVENAKMKYDFDLVRAKELMKKAGFPDGKDLPVINFDLRGSDSVNRQMGEFFTQALGEIGVKINVVLNTFPAYLEKSKKGALQMSYGGWQLDYPDVENVYQLLYGPNAPPGPNDAMMNDPKYNKLYEKLSTMDPGPARARIVKEMDDLIQEETPWAFGFYRDDYSLYQGWVLNYKGNTFIRDTYKYLRIDKELKAALQKNF